MGDSGSGRAGLATTWQPWHAITNLSTALCILDHQTFVPRCCFVPITPRWPSWANCEGAFTPDANDANKSRYSGEVGRLNILSLLASFAREIHYTTDVNTRHGRGFCRQLQSRCKMYSCFCKSMKMYIQLRVSTCNHNYFVLHCCFGFSASARNDVTARASSWLVNVARISAKVQIFQLALFRAKKTLNSRHSRRLIRANSASGLSFTSLHWLNM